jgi:transposase
MLGLEGKLLMSGKERERKVILESVKAGYFNLKDASNRLNLSYRQTKRIYQRYRKEGDVGLVHRSRGRQSNVAYSKAYRQKIITKYQQDYFDFGPTLAVEKLAEQGQTISRETLRHWLKEAGLWQARRKRSPYRRHRTRRERFGELLQLDGSHHLWFGEPEKTACLMNLVDDASGKTLALLALQETTEAAMTLLKNWIERYGIPKAIYVDLKTVYVSPQTNQTEETQDKPQSAAFTHFSRACARLGIQIIKAYSPQAKGRVERSHAVYQDRLVKELRLQHIKTLEKANSLLTHGFIDKLNEKFEKAPANPEDGHRPVEKNFDFNQIFCWEYPRIVQNDWTIQFEKQQYQIEKNHALQIRRKQQITVRKQLDGQLSLWKGEQRLTYTLCPPMKKQQPYEKKGYASALCSENARRNKHKTPWNTFNPGWLKQNKKLALDKRI